MYQFKNKIKEENKEIIGIEPVVDLEHFMILLLADLASKSKIHYCCDDSVSTACLSCNYKKTIENIMYEENGWGSKFASLIDINEYYGCQSYWERKVGNAFKEALNSLDKSFRYDFEFDEFEIDFTKEEITNIKSMYDEETLIVMDHFSNLLNDPSYTRKFELENKESKRFKNKIKNMFK